MCAGPRFNYYARTLPPGLASDGYAKGHDEGMWTTHCAILERPDLKDRQESHSGRLATLPLCLGGLGLRSAVRTCPAAFLGGIGRHAAYDEAKVSRAYEPLFAEFG